MIDQCCGYCGCQLLYNAYEINYCPACTDANEDWLEEEAEHGRFYIETLHDKE